MAIQSMDQLVTALSAGQKWRTDWNKNALPTTAQVAGQWYDLFGGAGNPGASTVLGTGTNLTFQSLSETTTNAASIPHGGNVSTSVKQLLNASVFSAAATTAPAVFMLVDMLAYFPITTTTTTGAQTLLGTQTLPRYADGKGVVAYLVPSTVMGAGTPTCQLSYTKPGGTAGRLTPSTPALPTLNTTSPVGSIPYSGTGAGKYGPFIPLAAGDNGILSVQSVNFSATMTSGVMNLVLCRPLCTIPITTVGVAGERDLLNQIPSAPIIYDGACLNWLMYAGAATPVNSAFYGAIETAWG
jgi:hypothetical protein